MTANTDPLFPLALVPFELYMLADQRRAYPMTFPMRVELEGVPERAALDAAFRAAMERHPLLNSRVVRKGFKRVWVPRTEAPPQLRWHAETNPTVSVGFWLDITAGPGVDGSVFVNGGRSCLVFLFHHAVCDGIGAIQFIGDVLADYGCRVDGSHRKPTIRPLNAESLRQRGTFDAKTPVEISAWDVVRCTVQEGWTFLKRRPQALANCRPPGRETNHHGREMLIGQLEASVYGRIVQRARQVDVTANDVLLRDMFLTIFKWNEIHARTGGRSWLRINMPTSLRGKRDTRMPAANVLGYAFLTRHGCECVDPDRLLVDIANDTKAIRTWSMGALFVEALQAMARIPLGMLLGTRLMRRPATVVLSNLGDHSRRFHAWFPRVEGEIQAGNLTLKGLAGTPPVRPGTRIAMAMSTYGGRLTVGIHADRQYFSDEDARGFLNQYFDQLRQTARQLEESE